MVPDVAALWTRRTWLTTTTAAAIAVVPRRRHPRWAVAASRRSRATAARLAAQGATHDATTWQTLAQRALEAAQHAGAAYADVRLTRTVQHRYGFDIPAVPQDTEMTGMGVRVLVDGYWGFLACPVDEVQAPAEAVVALAQEAVAQARANATGGTPRTVDMGTYPRVTGTWATPVAIDPFTISIEEKGEYIAYWQAWAREQGVYIDTLPSFLAFAREERLVATSDGSLVTQTRYESAGKIACKSAPTDNLSVDVEGLQSTGRGWELFTTVTQIPTQLTGMLARLLETQAQQQRARPVTVGRYTLVCDGATMASLVGEALGWATQLDRALGYEANAGGTSFIDDPLAMVGEYAIAASPVTVTANRSAPTQLATVKWDDEGVAPPPFTLVQDGVLVDFQTTREQAAWLAPYYRKHGRPVQSHGCAFAADALSYPLQQRPNLALAPNAQSVSLSDLVANVKDGVLVTKGVVLDLDFQGRTGLLAGTLRKITNGTLGPFLQGGAVQFDTLDLCKHVMAVGGAATAAVVSHSPYTPTPEDLFAGLTGHWKGQPPQSTSYSVTGVAATITNQPIINPLRKA